MQEVKTKSESQSLVGKILHTSWGYDMTINEYAVIVAETDKSVKCRMLKPSISNDDGRGNGKALPTLTEIEDAPEFRLFKREWRSGGIYFKGSYPFAGNSKRLDCFNLWDGRAKYHNTWD